MSDKNNLGHSFESNAPWIIWSKWWMYLYCLWGPQGKNTEVVCHSLLQWTTFCQNSPPWCNHLGWPYTTNCGKFFKRWEYGTTLPASWEICMQVKKQQLEPNMEQWTGSQVGKTYLKAVYRHPSYLTSMQSTSCEILGCMKHKLESRLPAEISITSDI